MSYRKLIGFLLVVVTSLLVISIWTLLPCDSQRNYVCEGVHMETIGQPLSMSSVALGLVFLILLFLPGKYFRAWLKYAAWFIPVGALLIITSDVNCTGGLGLGLCFDKELATWWSSGIYLVLSLLVIGITFFTSTSTARLSS